MIDTAVIPGKVDLGSETEGKLIFARLVYLDFTRLGVKRFINRIDERIRSVGYGIIVAELPVVFKLLRHYVIFPVHDGELNVLARKFAGNDVELGQGHPYYGLVFAEIVIAEFVLDFACNDNALARIVELCAELNPEFLVVTVTAAHSRDFVGREVGVGTVRIEDVRVVNHILE